MITCIMPSVKYDCHKNRAEALFQVFWFTRYILPRSMLVIKQQEPYRYQPRRIGLGLLSRLYLLLHLRFSLHLRRSPDVLRIILSVTQSIAWSGPLFNTLSAERESYIRRCYSVQAIALGTILTPW